MATHKSSSEEIANTTAELKNAWDDLMSDIQAARDMIDDPKFFPPEATPRVLSEGYRYLAGFMHHGIERAFHEDPQSPAFRNALSTFNKSTIENPDAVYFYAPIDGSKPYLVKGQIEDFRHWRGEAPASDRRIAPQYVIFEVATGPMAGDTGDLSELVPGFRTGFGTLDSSNLQVADDGTIELLLAPEKPKDWTGNFICTRKPPSSRNPEAGDRYAGYISGRQLFHDWKNEEPVHLSITPLDPPDELSPALNPETAAANLRRMGSIIRGQMKFWLEFYDVVLDCNGTHAATRKGQYFMPENGYNEPNGASSDTGGGMSTNIYAGGIYDLEEDEAFYIEASYSGEPVYTSFHLGNMWGESPEYANHQSSLNAHQMYMGPDGVQRWVVAHRDPGVQNWIDTTGLPRGYLSHRWAYSVIPEKKDWPKITGKKIRFDEIDAHFPADMPRITPSDRRAEMAVRQAHVQRRYRVF
jgi:hypothetical protein